MRANILILVCLAVLLQGVVSNYYDAAKIMYPSSDAGLLAGPRAWLNDFSREDLAPADQRLLDDADNFLTPKEKEEWCNDWKPDTEDDETDVAMPLSTTGNDSVEEGRHLSDDERARKLSIRERLADLDNRVKHVHGRRLCSWVGRNSCGCLACRAGHYYLNCWNVRGGKSIRDTSIGKCHLCDKGKYIKPNSPDCWKTCRNCPVGKYDMGSDNSANRGKGCTDCPAGRIGTRAGLFSKRSCKKCPAGSYCSGGASQEQCAAGRYSGASTQACQDCQPGKIAPSPGFTSCTCCPAGQYSGNGGTRCSDCAAGTFSNGCKGSCEACQAGRYMGGRGAGSCELCGAGRYAAKGATKCQICPPGTSNAYHGQPACPKCEAGKYQSNSGRSSCVACGAGKISQEGATSCTTCSPGTYENDNRQCKPCHAGRYSGSGAEICQNCQPGFYAPAGAASCTPCTPGKYQNAQAQGSCLSCPSGQVAPGQGSLTCTKCGTGKNSCTVTNCCKCTAGKYAEESGQGKCDTCSGGKYSDTGAAGCGTCPEGKHSGGAESDGCEKCKPGEYSEKGAAACAKCEGGKYNNGHGYSSCTKCPAGKFSNDGDTSCTVCPKGKFSSSDGSPECEDCAAGRYAQFTTMTECDKCSIGKISANKGASGCTDCQPGTFAPSAGTDTCSSCQAGTYQNKPRSGKCLACTSGQRSGVGASVCIDCAKGRYSMDPPNNDCIDCPAGTYAPNTKTNKCDECEIGKYSPVAKSSSCTKCEKGKFNGNEGQTECIPCALGKYADLAGLASCASCAKGKYAGNTGQSLCDDCALGKARDGIGASDCKNCEPGEYTDMKGQHICKLCGIGKSQAAAGQSGCVACAVGKYSQGSCIPMKIDPTDKDKKRKISYNTKDNLGVYLSGDPDYANDGECQDKEARAEVCDPCDAGKYQNTTGNWKCIDCPTGKYDNTRVEVPDAGAIQCMKCAGGFYQPSEGQTTCEECPADTYQNNTGSSTCRPCPIGESTKGFDKQQGCVCDAGWFHTQPIISWTNPDEADQHNCHKCPKGSTSVPTTRTIELRHVHNKSVKYPLILQRDAVCVCDVDHYAVNGNFNNFEMVCEPCPLVPHITYTNNLTNQSECIFVPTSQPTSMPSSQPSGQPTSIPTQPSSVPTSQPSGEPTGQPTSAPSVYIVPVAKDETDIASESFIEGTSWLDLALIAAAILLFCCLLIGFLIYRRARRKPEDIELSPYEKWIRNEEMKKAGQGPAMFVNDSSHATFDHHGKDGKRLRKLHTKHGVAMDPNGGSNHNPMQQPKIGNQRTSAVGFADLYKDPEDDRIQGTWMDQEFITSQENLASTHNPMNAAKYADNEGVPVEELDTGDIYGNDGNDDFEGNIEYELDQDEYDAYPEEEWVDNSGIEFANEEERRTFQQEVEDDEDPFGDDEEDPEDTLERPPPPPDREAPVVERQRWADQHNGGTLPDYERPNWNQNIGGDTRAAEMRRQAAAGSAVEVEDRSKAASMFDIYRRVNLYPSKKK